MDINFNSERHLRYKKYWNIFDNNPDFDKPTGKYLSMPIPMEIAKLYRDIGFSKGISSRGNNDDINKALDRLIYENDFNTLISEAGLICAVKGDIILKNYIDEIDGQSRITFIKPELYFPEFDKFNSRKIIRETIAVTVEEEGETFLYTETYEKRNGEYWCITKKNQYSNGEIGEEIGQPEEVNTNLTLSPLTHVPFSRVSESIFGHSLYMGMKDLFQDLNWRISQISKIMDKFTTPNIIGSENMLNEGYQFQMSDEGVYLPVEIGEQKPEYMQWKPELDAHIVYVNELIIKMIQYVSPLNDSLYGLSKESANSSSLSIKLKAFRSAQTVENSLKYWQNACKKVLYLALQLDVLAGNGDYEPVLPNIELKASMPEDANTKAQEEQILVTSGLTSRKSAIARLRPHYTKNEVDNEFMEIINEENERERLTFINDNPNYSLDEAERAADQETGED